MSIENLPCGHPVDGSLFDLKGGGRALITHEARDIPFGRMPATVWCAEGCGWVDCDDQYTALEAVRR